MGKTIKLTEEQIRRFFGEGFGKRLIGEGGDAIKPGVQYPGDVDYTGNLNRARFDYTGGNDSNLAVSAIVGKQQFGNSRITGNVLSSMLKNGKSGDASSAIDMVIKALFQANGNRPVGIIDLMQILNEAFTETSIREFVDTIDIVTILSGFIGLDAPNYVYYRLMNLTPAQLDNISKRFGKDFELWGSKCDGCGATGWTTTVPVAEHDEAYTVFDFGATDNETLSSAGHSLKEGRDKTAGFKLRKISFADYKMLEMHHINGDASNNSAYNIACLCPNCHSCVDSTSKGKTIDFGEDFILRNGGEIREGSILGQMSPEKQDYFRKTVVDRVMHGYYSDRSLATYAAYGGSINVSDSVLEILQKLHLPSYVNSQIDVNIFSKSIKDALALARKEVAKENANTEKLYNALTKTDKEYQNDAKEDENGEEQLSEAKVPTYFLYMNKQRVTVPGSKTLSVKYSFSSKKSEVVMKIYGNREMPSVIILNALGDENPKPQDIFNIIDRIVKCCVDSLSEFIAGRTETKSNTAQNVKSGGSAAFVSGYEPDACIGNVGLEKLVSKLNKNDTTPIEDKTKTGKYTVLWGEETVKKALAFLRTNGGLYGDGKMECPSRINMKSSEIKNKPAYKKRVCYEYAKNGYYIKNDRAPRQGLWGYEWNPDKNTWSIWETNDAMEKLIENL